MNASTPSSLTPLESLVACGTKLWLDSVDPDLVRESLGYRATGATSNPAIISALIQSGRFDRQLVELIDRGLDDDAIAWELADRLVRDAQELYRPAFDSSGGDDGYVSFELDPLLEDAGCPLSFDQRVARYIELGKHWSAGHRNRMIKVPATEAGIAALEELVAAGVTVNVTLLFTMRQYRQARDAVWRGAQRRESLDGFKSVYSIFVSRIDAYTHTHVPELSAAAQGLVGIVNAKRIWRENQRFWSEHPTPLKQEIVFASMGTKLPGDPPDKYVEALAGSDIQTNPPATNAAVQKLGKRYVRRIDQMPDDAVLSEIDQRVDFERMEAVLMAEGVEKFAEPQRALLELIGRKRATLTAAS
ncbi:MAG: transaldolase [Planctomycetota bacterium]|nr:MAG: transaldolase [Planctomycetota bacterium]